MTYSAGIIPFRINNDGKMEFFLGHSGGDYRNYWSFLKGGVERDEKWQETALREFKEESGIDLGKIGANALIPLGSVTQNPRKTVIAYGIHFPGIDERKCFSNKIPETGLPEIDRYRWMTFDELKHVTHMTHLVFYQKLMETSKKYGV